MLAVTTCIYWGLDTPSCFITHPVCWIVVLCVCTCSLASWSFIPWVCMFPRDPFCILKPEEQQLYWYAQRWKTPQIIHFGQTTTGCSDTHWGGNDCGSVVADRIFPCLHSVRRCDLGYEKMCKNWEEEKGNGECFVTCSLSYLSCSWVLSWYMHQATNTLPEGKLPHTTSSSSTGSKDITLMLLAALLQQNCSLHLF